MPNIYMGKNSVAGIPTRGKVNTDKEILLNTYATAYDSINKFMLDNNARKLERTDKRTIVGRFAILSLLCKKHCKHKLPLVNRLRNLALSHSDGKMNDLQYLREIRNVSRQHGVNASFLDMVEAKINSAEARANFSKQKPVFIPMQGIVKHKAGPGRLPLLGVPLFAARRHAQPSAAKAPLLLSKRPEHRKAPFILPNISTQNKAPLFLPSISLQRKAPLFMPKGPEHKKAPLILPKINMPQRGASLFGNVPRQRMPRKTVLKFPERKAHPFLGFFEKGRKNKRGLF